MRIGLDPGALLRAERAVGELLSAYQTDANDPELANTPRRVAASLAELLGGIGQDERTPLMTGSPVQPGMELVALRSLEFRSICAHHLLPFSGSVDVVYQPRARILGIGAIVRSLEILSTRPQLQERLATELAAALCEAGGADGSFVSIKARHSCIADRGPREADSRLVTIASHGSLQARDRRREILATLER